MNKLCGALVLICGFAFFGSTVGRAQTAPLSDLDSLRYIASHGDLIEAFGADAAKGRAHYQDYGQKEGRKITFDPLTYLASHPDLIGAFGLNEEQAVRHYINFGYKEKRATAGFNGLAYIASFIDLMDAFGVDSVKATRHYVEYGYKEGRRITFNALSYIASHADLIAAFGIDEVAGAKHFIQFGFKEGRRVSFDPAVYLSLHGDLQAAFGKDVAAATRHYIQFGFKEGRAAAGPVIQLSASALAFESQRANSTSAAKVVTVDNTGVSPLTISSVALSGSNAADFTQTHNCASVAAGARCTINVVFSPTSAGAKTASLVLTHNAGSGSSTVALSGTATSGAAVTLKTDLEVLSYIASYADLMQAIGLNIAAGRSHYEDFGAKEGRKITFDALSYIASHGDLIGVFGIDAAAGARHFIEYGYKEGRRVSFDPSVYLSLHADLRSAFGSDTAAATRHYIQFGFKEGRATVGQPVIQISPSSIDFGNVTQGSISASRTVLVANVGTAPLTVAGISVTGSSTTQFSQSNNCSSVAAGASCTISVTFTPTSTGTKSASISISHNAGGSPTTVSLTGSGAAIAAPGISVTPTILNFTQAVNTTSAAQVFTVRNTGTLNLTITSITSTDAAQFPGTQTCTTSSLAPDASCRISIAFKPTSAGSKSASIVINHNATGGSTTLSVIGTATSSAPSISVSPSTLSFESQAINTAGVTKTITLSNTGNATLTVSAVNLTGSDASQFLQTNNCASVPAGGSCTINVVFRPTSAGSKSASLLISHNASGSATTVSLTGSGASSGLVMSDLSLTLNVLGLSQSSVTGTVAASSANGTPVTYSIQSQGAYGSSSINATTGQLTYTVADLLAPPNTTTDRVVVAASAGTLTTTANVNVSLGFDPLLTNQWHLRNVGQNTFSSLLPVDGNDINVASAWAAGYSGRGVKVAVVDSGLEIAHEDLSRNIDVNKSKNLVTGSNDPSPSAAYDHGTMVAGIIAASAFNAVGGRGVSYNATLRGYNLLAAGVLGADAASIALGGNSISSDNDIFNQSFGVGPNQNNKSLQAFNNLDGELNYNITTLRQGKGAIGIQSAGNEFLDFRGDASTCDVANGWGVSCGHVASDTRRASTYPIIVGATAADGKKASYSTTGASIWLAAPGGEYGVSSSYVSNLAPSFYRPAIVTTTTTGCSRYSQSFNALDSLGANSLSARCQYTARMNGTSAAAPVVSGVVALMLEANPNLSYRDVKHIFATTAKQVDASFSPISRTGLQDSGPVVLEQGWVRNAAGHLFHNWYGFGQVDAGRAVSAARSYTSYLPPRNDGLQATLTATTDITIGPRSAFTFTSNVTSGMSVIEGIVLFANFDTAAVACNQIEVVSPSGTKSILLNGGTGFTQSVVRDVRFVSNAFYGESPVGVWTFTYRNLCSSTARNTVILTGLQQNILYVGR